MAEHIPPETGGLTERGDGAAVVCEDQGRIRVPAGVTGIQKALTKAKEQFGGRDDARRCCSTFPPGTLRFHDSEGSRGS